MKPDPTYLLFDRLVPQRGGRYAIAVRPLSRGTLNTRRALGPSWYCFNLNTRNYRFVDGFSSDESYPTFRASDLRISEPDDGLDLLRVRNDEEYAKAAAALSQWRAESRKLPGSLTLVTIVEEFEAILGEFAEWYGEKGLSTPKGHLERKSRGPFLYVTVFALVRELVEGKEKLKVGEAIDRVADELGKTVDNIKDAYYRGGREARKSGKK